LGHPPSPREKQVMQQALDRFTQRYEADPKAAEEFLSQGDAPRDKSLKASQLAAYTVVASLILNLDEVITNE
jgi:hypothetical protein